MSLPGISQADAAVDSILGAVEGLQRGMPALSSSTFATATPPSLKLRGIDLDGMEDGIQPPVGGVMDVNVPSSVTLPTLTAPAVSGTAATIALAFSAPVLGAVTYKEGISAPAPTYGSTTDEPGYTPAPYVGTASPPDTSIVFSVIPAPMEVTLLDIAKYALGTIEVKPINELVIPELPIIQLANDMTKMEKFSSEWANDFIGRKDHMTSSPYERFMNSDAMAAYVEAKIHPQLRALQSKRRAILAQHAARGFNGPVGAAVEELSELAREEADMILSANNEARQETKELIQAAMLATADMEMKVEKAVIDQWLIWAKAPLALAGKYNNMAIQIIKDLAAMYNQNVSLISEHVDAYRAYAAAGRSVVQAQIAEASQDKYIAENYSAVVELFRARTKHWVAEIKQYALEVKGATLPIEAYQVVVASAMIDAQIARANIGMYADAVSTFGEKTKLYADNLELWGAAYRADGSKFDVSAANLQAYRQAVGNEQDRIRSYMQYIDASTDAFSAKTSELNAALQANSSYMSILGDIVQVAKDYTSLSGQAVSANAKAQAGTAAAEASYKAGRFSVTMNKYATDLAVLGANNQIEVANQTYKKQGDQVRMAAISSYLQGLYSSVVQSVSADVRYSGETQFSGSDSLSEDTRSSWSQSVKNTNRYVIEPSV
jgi:hypothetical protein